MGNSLRSAGLDVGTTSTQLILSRLTVENRASAFAVLELEIARREILYRSPVHFTPLLDESHVDGAALRTLVDREYQAAGITRETVDTGAVIITGESARKENAAAVLDKLSGFAGEFVVSTAGPDLESIIAGKGSGAYQYSMDNGCTAVNLDIGGGKGFSVFGKNVFDFGKGKTEHFVFGISGNTVGFAVLHNKSFYPVGERRATVHCRGDLFVL